MSKKILIIDDDPDIVLFLSTVLQDHGYETVNALDGREGLEKTSSDRPDLILLDLMMPHKSGIALLNDLQKDEDLKTTPVIMVTGVSGETGINLDAFMERSPYGGNCSQLGGPKAFIEKPIDIGKLLSAVEHTIGPPEE